MGHLKRNCPQRASTSKNEPDCTTKEIRLINHVPAYKVHVKVGTSDFDCIVDTGSPISMLIEEAAPTGVQLQKCGLDEMFEGINGAKLKILGTTKQPVTFTEFGVTVELNFYVIKSGTMSSMCLLGRDMVRHSKLIVNIGKIVNIKYNRSNTNHT